MTLEDLYTLTEMKDGLTSHSMVEELIFMMRKDTESLVKNVSEASRLWCIVANSLAVTENRDSLDHFVHLDGLLFLDRWLEEAQKFSNDACDNSVEESISLLLGALKKLPIDDKRSVLSGIGVTVKKLFAHKSFRIQERARSLFDSWNQGKCSIHDHQEIGEVGGFLGDRVNQDHGVVTAVSWCLNHSSLDSDHVNRNADGKPMGSEHQHSRSSDGSHSMGIGDVNSSVISNKDKNHTILNQEKKEDGFREAQGSSFMSNSCPGSISVMEETSTCPAERTSPRGICSIPASVQWGSSDIPKLKDLTNNGNESYIRSGRTEDIDKKETCFISASSGPESFCSADHTNVQQDVMLPDALRNADAKEPEVYMEKTLPAGVDNVECTVVMESNGGGVESGILKSKLEVEGTDQVGESHSDVMQNSSFDGCNLRKRGNLEASFSEEPGTETADDADEHAVESILKVAKDYETDVAISQSETDAKITHIYRDSDMEFDYGIDDALEVARQVAKEVEREVVDYREQLCSSSSERKSEVGVVQPGSPDSINNEQDQSMVELQRNEPVSENLPCRVLSPNEEDHLMKSEHADKTNDHMDKGDSSQSAEILPKPVDVSKKIPCDFDLNEVCLEELDQPTITFVSASKVTPAGVPRTPLHFEGELGWKGTAATSAFRPASPRRTPDGEKPLSIEGSVQRSNQRQGFFEFDLNVADGDDSHIALENPILVSTDIPSGESSIEVNSRRAQRLKWDLNRIGDTDDPPSSDCRIEERPRYHHGNGSPSPASSSSSRQFPMRNIDLNGNPSFFDDSCDQRPGFSKISSLSMNTSGSLKVDDPAVSIFGSRVGINRSELIPQTQSFLQNGHAVDYPFGAVFTKPENSLGSHRTMAYTSPPSSMFGYNGFSMGSPVSLPPAMYRPGSVPCLIDSRRSPMIPQMMPPSSNIPTSQPPFFVSMTGPIMGLNGVSRPSFDLNSGYTVDTESRETGGFRQLIFPGPGIVMDEQARSVPQPMGTGVGAKRKEPDSGWGLYPGGYKNQPPWF